MTEYSKHLIEAHYRLSSDNGQLVGYIKGAIRYLESGADTMALSILRHALALQDESDRKRDEAKQTIGG